MCLAGWLCFGGMCLVRCVLMGCVWLVVFWWAVFNWMCFVGLELAGFCLVMVLEGYIFNLNIVCEYLPIFLCEY